MQSNMKWTLVFVACFGPVFSSSQEFYSTSPYFASSSSQQQVRVEETVTFECQVVNVGQNVITWHNGSAAGRVIFAGPVNVISDDRLTTSQNGAFLTITNVTEHDAGEYYCAVNLKESPLKLTHRLDVLVPPRVSPSPADGNYVVKTGSDVELKCDAHGSPRPTITWFKKGQLLPTGKLKERGEILELNDVDRIDSGVYECHADNGVGNPMSAEVVLQVLYPPEIRVPSQRVYAGPGLGEATLTCLIHGDPQPKVTWRLSRRNKEVTSNGKYTPIGPDSRTRYNLTIARISEEDFGIYECIASNSLGRAAGTVELTGEPEKPIVLSDPISREKTSYVLRWSVKSPYPIKRQQVTYWLRNRVHDPRSTDSLSSRQQAKSQMDLPNDHRLLKIANDVDLSDGAFGYEVELSQLEPDANYIVQIKAVNSFQEGEWSEQFNFYTTGAAHIPTVQGKSGLTGGSPIPRTSGLFVLPILCLLRQTIA